MPDNISLKRVKNLAEAEKKQSNNVGLFEKCCQSELFEV